MKRKSKVILLLITAVFLLFALSACGSESGISYDGYDGYSYWNPADGHVKYTLDTKDGVKLHCFFMSGEPEYYEVVYTFDMESAEEKDNVLTVKKVTDSNGTDISNYFKTLSFTFSDEEVLMKVERDESTLAGGTEDNVLTGEYTLTPDKK